MSFFDEGIKQIQQNADKINDIEKLVIKNHTDLTNQIKKNTADINNNLSAILKPASAAYIDNTTKNSNEPEQLVLNNQAELKNQIQKNTYDINNKLDDILNSASDAYRNNTTKNSNELEQLVLNNQAELKNQIQKNTDNINNKLDDILNSASDAYSNNTTKIINKLEQLVLNNQAGLKDQIQENTDKINKKLNAILNSASAAYSDSTTKINNKIDKLNEKLDEYIYKQKQNGGTNLFYADTTQSQMFTESGYIKAVNVVIEACELVGTLHRHVNASNKKTIKSFYNEYANFFSLLFEAQTIIIPSIIAFGMKINTAAKTRLFLDSNSNNTTNFTEWQLFTNDMYKSVSRALSRVLAEGINMANKTNIQGGSLFKSMKTLLFTKLKTIHTSKTCGITTKLLPEDNALLKKTRMPNTDTSFTNFTENLAFNGNPMPKIPAYIQYMYHLNVEKPVFLAFNGIIENNFQDVRLLDTPNNGDSILTTPRNEVINALQNIDAKSYMQTINTQTNRIKNIPPAEMKSILKLTTIFGIDHIRGFLDATNQNNIVTPYEMQKAYITSTIKDELSTLKNVNKIQSSIFNGRIQNTPDVFVVTDQGNEITQYQVNPILGAFLKCASKKTFEIAYDAAINNKPFDIDDGTISVMTTKYPGILNQITTLVDVIKTLTYETKNTLMALDEGGWGVINILTRIYSAVVTNVKFLTRTAMSSWATYLFLLVIAAGEMYTNDAGREIPEQFTHYSNTTEIPEQFTHYSNTTEIPEQFTDYSNTTEIGDNSLARLQPFLFSYIIHNTEVTPFIAAVVGHFLPFFNFLINESSSNSFTENNDTYALQQYELQPQETDNIIVVIGLVMQTAWSAIKNSRFSFPS